MPLIVFAAIFLIISLLVIQYSYLSLGKNLQRSRFKKNKITYFIFLFSYIVVLLLSFVFFSFREGISIYRYSFYIISPLSFFFFILSMVLLVFDTCIFLFKEYSLFIATKIRRYKYYFSLLLAITILIFSFFSRYFIFTEEIVIQRNTKKTPIPKTRIVVISDLHLGVFNNSKLLRLWVDNINKLRPDYVLIIGDIVDYNLGPVINNNMVRILNKIKAPVYSVMGNHDSIEKNNKVSQYLRKNSQLHLLEDESLILDNKFYIIGRKDAGFRDKATRKPLKELINSKNSKKYTTILLDHQPPKNYLEIMETYPQIDIILSGHTHGLQIFPLNIIGDYLLPLNRGHIKNNKQQHFIVTQGIGAADAFPFRLGTKSEIIILELE